MCAAFLQPKILPDYTEGDPASGILPIPKKFKESDPYVQWIKNPHTISFMMGGFAILIYVAFTRDSSDTVANVKYGLIAACAIFLLFAMLQFKDGLFYRPHPAFWRIIKGCAVIYLVGAVFFMFLNENQARGMFSYIDPKLGKPLPERSYAEDCRLYTPEDPQSNFRNFRDAVFDEFIIAHLLGWFGKAFLFRDVYISWGWSILFEFCELTFAHILPNFAECWWDQIILDILLCNGIGIWLGHLVMNYLQMKPYNWTGMKHDQSNPPEGFGLLGAFRQLTPRELTPYKWEVFSSARRFFSVLFVFVLAASIELNCFFLKAVFWHPPSHPLVIGRLFMMWLFSLPALREIYQYISDPNCKRLGTMAWLTTAIIFVENCVWFKFSGDLMAHAKPTPAAVIYSWTAFVIVLLGGSLIYFGFYKPMRDRIEAEAAAAAAAVTGSKQSHNAENTDLANSASPKGVRRRRTSVRGK